MRFDCCYLFEISVFRFMCFEPIFRGFFTVGYILIHFIFVVNFFILAFTMCCICRLSGFAVDSFVYFINYYLCSFIIFLTFVFRPFII